VNARGMRRYLAATVAVRLADEGARVALVLLALERTASVAVGGVLVAALLVPHVVAAPAVGWLTDRATRPRLVIAVAALGFAAALAAPALLLGRVPTGLAVAVLLVGGCCGPALTGGLTSRLPDLVDTAALPRAFGADSLTYNVSGVGGPALAGGVAATAGAGPALLALATLAALGAAVTTALPPGRRTAGDDGPPDLVAGARAIVRDPVLRTVTAAASVGQLGPGALAVAAAALATAQGHPTAAGGLLTAVAVGGVVGSLWWTWRPSASTRCPRTVMLALLGVGAPVVLAAPVGSSLLATGVLFAVSGVFLGPFAGALFTTRQAHAPAAARAQVFTISAGLKTTAAAAGAALGGGLAHLPPSVQLVLVGSTPLVAGGVGALALSTARRRAPVPAPSARR
jgi:hypothetical protein